MSNSTETIAICGAGIAGIATAYYLTILHPKAKIVLIDKQQAMSFTTSKSGENFRDFWPQKWMRDLSIHSIELMQNLRSTFGQEAFKMVFSGYNFISRDKEKAIFSGDLPQGENGFYEESTDKNYISPQYPYLDEAIQRVTCIKNAGNIDVYAMGTLMLQAAKKQGLQEQTGEITDIKTLENGFEIVLHSSANINANKIVIAAGPFINHLAQMLGLQFPIQNTLQHKFIIPDPLHIIPRDMPFTIYADAQFLDWSAEEKAFFQSEEKYAWLLEEFPGGLHIKPEGEGIKLGWAFNRQSEQAQWEPRSTEWFPQVVLKGASRFMPALAAYAENIPTPIIEYAGYYTRTEENWPLIGSTEVSNVYVVGALSGFGTMTACAAGELCAKYLLQDEKLPDYAPYFHPNRYQVPSIVAAIEASKSDGQL